MTERLPLKKNKISTSTLCVRFLNVIIQTAKRLKKQEIGFLKIRKNIDVHWMNGTLGKKRVMKVKIGDVDDYRLVLD